MSLLFLTLMAVGYASGPRNLFRAAIDDPKGIFGNVTAFKTHGPTAFNGVTAANLRRLLNRIRHENWLLQFANLLTGDDMQLILGTHARDILEAAIPLINELPISLLSLLGAQDFSALEAITSKRTVESFNRNRISKLPLDRQKQLAPQLPRQLRPYLGAAVLVHLVESGRCDLLGIEIFKNLSKELAQVLDGPCLSRLDKNGDPLSMKRETAQLLPNDAFAEYPPINLDLQTYKAMTISQLVEHLKNWVPTKKQVQAINTADLRSALERIVKDPIDTEKLDPRLISELPPTVMSVLRRSFWASIDGDKSWKLSTAQLLQLPEDAFTNAPPKFLNQVELTFSSNSHAGDRAIGALLHNLGKDDQYRTQHPCTNPSGLLIKLKSNLMTNLLPECVENIDANAMSIFHQPGHLNALTLDAVRRMTATQVERIPTTSLNDNAKAFLKNLFQAGAEHYDEADPNSVGCGGITPEQAKEFKSPSTWALLNYECLSVLNSGILIELPPESVARIPVAAFERFSMPVDDGTFKGVDVVRTLLPKLSPSQMAVLGTEIDEGTIHPCTGAIMNWEETKPRTVSSMHPVCLGNLHPSSFSNLPEKSISTMEEKILRGFKSQRQVAAIPAEAFLGVKGSQLKHLKAKIAGYISANQLLAMARGRATESLSPLVIAALPVDTFLAGLEEKIALSDDALAGMTYTQFTEASWINKLGDSLSPRQWRSLAALKNDLFENHPCSMIHREHTDKPSAKNFWMGISPLCLSSLGFLDKITTEELKLIPDSAFQRLNRAQQDILASKLGADQSRLEHGRDCATYTSEAFRALNGNSLQLHSSQCYSELQPQVLESISPSQAKLLPPHALVSLRREQVSAIPREALSVLDKDQWDNFGVSLLGICCSGFTSNQAPVLPISKMPIACVTSMSPEVFASLSEQQFSQIPQSAWKDSISHDQVAAIPPSYFANFPHFDYFGLTWPSTAPTMHPCLGITTDQRKAMSEITLAAFEKRCSLTIAENPPENSLIGVLLILAGVLVLVPLTVGGVCLYWRWRYGPIR